jgi:Sec-independent protein translocase protein TatA
MFAFLSIELLVAAAPIVAAVYVGAKRIVEDIYGITIFLAEIKDGVTDNTQRLTAINYRLQHQDDEQQKTTERLNDIDRRLTAIEAYHHYEQVQRAKKDASA